MKPMIANFRRAFFIALATYALSPTVAKSATFSADLTLAPTSGHWGEHLTASYDFGLSFRAVHSVWIELDMPAGYQGTMMSTGNSMLHRRLAMEIHAPSDPPPVESLFEYVGNSTILIPPGPPVKFGFGRWQTSFRDLATYVDYPAFLLSGSGSVSIADVSTTYYHPLPDGEGSTATTIWNLPSGIENARLIVEATPVPEPSAGILALVGVAAYRCRRKRG
jgi:hypothetical protein